MRFEAIRQAVPDACQLHREARAARSRAIARMLAAAWRHLATVRAIQRSRRALREMSESQLADVGLTRRDVERAGWF